MQEHTVVNKSASLDPTSTKDIHVLSLCFCSVVNRDVQSSALVTATDYIFAA